MPLDFSMRDTLEDQIQMADKFVKIDEVESLLFPLLEVRAVEDLQ